jgi:RimJ/RimL family protein N-acetyltransferase
MLKGEKVKLRALERDDLPRLYEFNNDIAVELAGGGDPPMPQSLARLQAQYEQKVSGGGREGSDFAIEADGKFIGICALHNFDETAHCCELGITIGDPDYWGKGYGREALRLLLEHGFRYRNLYRVWLRVNGRNQRAQRAYAAVGFVQEGRLRQHTYNDGAFDDVVLMGILRSEWEK